MESFFQENGILSLAYSALDYLPNSLADLLGEKTEILDLSHNEIRDLKFLTSFPYLHTLVLDRNPNPDNSTLPYMPNLKILWLNNCNIINTQEWLHTIQIQCPHLKQLSMMCNPVGLTKLNGVTNNDEIKYRKEILKILPTLDYFDGIVVTEKERKEILNDYYNHHHDYYSTLSKISIKTMFDIKFKNLINFSNKQNNLKYENYSSSTSLIRY